MSFPSEKEVGNILDSYVMDELVSDYILEKKKSLLTMQIDTCEEEFKVLIQIPSNYPSGVYKIIVRDEKREMEGKLEDILLELLEEFEAQRSLFIDQYGGETPGSSQIESTPTGSTVIWDIVDEVGNRLVDHSIEANAFFGGNSTHIIKELDQVKFSIKPTVLTSEIKKLYDIGKNTCAIFGVQFNPDYIESQFTPNIFFKKEFFKDMNPGFSEQVVNIARKFLTERWQQIMNGKKIYFPDVDIDPDLDKKKKIAHVKAVLKDNRELAVSIALFYSNFKKEEAAFLFLEAGGVLEAVEDDGKPNVLLELIAYLTYRLTNLTNHCLICDGDITVQEVKNVPTICTRFQCQFDYIEMKNCNTIPVTICPISIVSDITENPEIVDLLICMCYSAAFSDRREKIFTPFPPTYEKKGSSKNYSAVEKVLSNFPSVSVMKKNCDSEKEFKKFLGDSEYELLRWILTTKRCALLKIPSKKQINSLGTVYQYFTLVDDPGKSATFAKDRTKYGSYFAFHGSGVENWHSILRNQLFINIGRKWSHQCVQHW
jgi:hypothetical protein